MREKQYRGGGGKVSDRVSRVLGDLGCTVTLIPIKQDHCSIGLKYRVLQPKKLFLPSWWRRLGTQHYHHRNDSYHGKAGQN